MFKKKILAVLLMISSINLFAEKCRVLLQQKIGPHGGEITDISSPLIPAGVEISLSYNFKVDAPTNKHGVIYGKIDLPVEFDIDFSGGKGISALEVKDNKKNGGVPALSIQDNGAYKSCEFLLPQEMDHVAEINFLVKIPESYKSGTRFPISVYFEHLQRPLLMRYGTAIGVAAGIATGVIVGVATFNPAVGVAGGVKAGLGVGLSLVGSTGIGVVTGVAAAGATTYVSYRAISESLQEIRKKYDPKIMHNSLASFYLTVK